MRSGFLLIFPLLAACGGAPAEPTTPEPTAPEPTAPEEPATSEAPATPEEPATPEGDAPPAEPPPADSCQKARDRIAECAKKDELAEATANECKKDFAATPKASEELARCLTDLGCKALAKSKSTKDGALGICFVAAKKKQIDPDAP